VAKQKFGLGRGLDALISGASEVRSAQPAAHADTDERAVTEVPVESIIPNPRQPRRVFREDDPKLLELSASIKEHGLIQPIVVTRLHSEADKQRASKTDTAWFGEEPSLAPQSDAVHYQIIAGERRWRASRMAGLTRVPVVIKEVTPQQMLELALIENLQRADLNPIEEALAYQALIQEFGLTQERIAQRVGKDRTTITNSLRLLQLAPKVREALLNASASFTEGHARALIGIARDEDQVTAMGKIIALRLNVRQAEELAAQIKAAQESEQATVHMSAPPARSPELVQLESHFRDALMVKVDLKRNAKGKGTLILHFNDQDELDRLYSRLVKREE
jgi:ParB family chromosome partitioning protein